MRDLVLVRHAVAEQRDPERWPDDSLRPLTSAGIERFRAIARGLRRIDVQVDAVLASPYARAWATGEILHEEVAWPSPESCPALAPPSPLSAVADAVRARKEATIALVGHQPQLSEIAALLLAGRERSMRLDLKKGGAMRLRLGGDWEPGTAALRWSVSPKFLRVLGR